MNRHALGRPSCSLALSLLLLGGMSGCGGDDTPPPPDVDAGDADAEPVEAGPRDAAPLDATLPDAGDVDSGVCPDEDGDGHGAAWCDDDCDDTDVNVNPDATEVCNGGRDDDCNGLADVLDGVCVPCPMGYTGFDGSCMDLDECLVATTCGGGRADCTNTIGSYACTCASGYAAPATGGTCMDVDECAPAAPCGVLATACSNTIGSYACTCASGYAAPATGGTCADVDECATTAPCGVLATACINTVGSYACSCLPGYGAPTTGGTCADLDECALGTCGAVGVVTSCVNSVGSYACTCVAGYTAPASGGPCTDINECALGTPCGVGLGSCANLAGSYVCTCNSGYAAPAAGGTCTDIDECAAPRSDDCDRDPAAACANTLGSFACACPVGFAPSATAGHGAGGCLLSDPSLSSLVPSAGALSPAFDSGTTMYTLTLPTGATSLTFTPSVAYPAHATITVDGVSVSSGAASAPISLLDFAPRPVLVTVTTETGATRTYAVVVGRGSAYIKASNTGASDLFGISVSLSADGTRLAVGAYAESSSATGIGGNQADNSAAQSGAVYVY